MRGIACFTALLLGAGTGGCPEQRPDHGAFVQDPDGGVDDDDDDRPAGDDDDSALVTPCSGQPDSGEQAPTIDFGGAVGEIAFSAQAACSTGRAAVELFGGWTDPMLRSLTVSVVLDGDPWAEVGQLMGQVARPQDVTSFRLALDLGSNGGRYLAPEGEGAVGVEVFDPDDAWKACVFEHGGTWTKEGGTETVTVPDAFTVVCTEG